MVWLKYLRGLPTILWLGAMLSLPAAAAQIKCSTDSRGVIHINNNAATQESCQTNPAPVAALPSGANPRDKDDKLRILNERRGRSPSADWQDMPTVPQPLAAEGAVRN